MQRENPDGRRPSFLIDQVSGWNGQHVLDHSIDVLIPEAVAEGYQRMVAPFRFRKVPDEGCSQSGHWLNVFLGQCSGSGQRQDRKLKRASMPTGFHAIRRRLCDVYGFRSRNSDKV